MMNSREKAIFVGGGVAYWALHSPVKRGKFLYRAANLVRFGTASSSVGLGTAVVHGGAVFAGAALGSGVLLAGTYTAEHFGLAPEGSTDHALDFVSGDVDNWYDYTIHYNVAQIMKHHFS